MLDATILKRVPLFAELGHDERIYLTATLAERALTPLETIFWVGDRGEELFVIQEGRVEICVPDHDGREIRLAVLGPGDFFGELSLLDGGTRSATARTLEETHVLVLDRTGFHDCMRRFPSMGLSVVNVLSRRQRETVEKLRGIRNLNEVLDQRLTRWQRLANAIADMAASKGFILTHAASFGGWIMANTLLGRRGLDPFPFPFLCFWASVEAIFLSLFILISQAMQGQKDRLRNEVEYQISLKMQLEMMQLHQKLDEQAAVLKRMSSAAPADRRAGAMADS